MLIVLSPAKNLDYDSAVPTKKHTKARLLDESEILMETLKQLAPHEISSLMSISDKLGVLNYQRNQDWAQPFTNKNARQAVLAFKGDVYIGLDAYSFDDDDFAFAQEHLRILSGLYGLLKPLDLIQPYRLEMGTKLANPRGSNLYEFWGKIISGELNKVLKKQGTQHIINLASNEYFKSVNKADLAGEVITPVFKDWKTDKYKIISFYAKKARGLMSAYIIKNKISDVEKIKGFDSEGYRFAPDSSSDSEWVFTRRLD